MILVTGCAGFIGYHFSEKVLKKNKKIIGIDNLNNYYSLKLKKDRLKNLKKNNNFKFFKTDLSNYGALEKIFKKNKITQIVHFAAQAGVRYSLSHPKAYLKSNLIGFFNILEIAKKFNIKNMIISSTSSVYGSNKKIPFEEKDKTEFPRSFYAASKKSNEVMAYAYSELYGLNITCLRFFTVYGPWGRPDMALFKFVKNIYENKKIDVYNFGKHKRDFTYISDIINAVDKILFNAKYKKKLKNKKIPFETFNLARSKPEKLLTFIKIIEKNLNKKAMINYLPMQKGDALDTFGINKKIKNEFKINFEVNLNEGISKFILWYKKYYKLK
jgi:UDP-glucuronate 4-epimerase